MGLVEASFESLQLFAKLGRQAVTDLGVEGSDAFAFFLPKIFVHAQLNCFRKIYIAH